MKKCIKRKKLYGYFWGGASLVLLSIAQQAQASCEMSNHVVKGGTAGYNIINVISNVDIPQIYSGSNSAVAEYINTYLVTCTGPHTVLFHNEAAALNTSLGNITQSNGRVTYVVTPSGGVEERIVFDIYTGAVSKPGGYSWSVNRPRTYGVRVTAPANRGITSNSYMRDYQGGTRSQVVTFSPTGSGYTFKGELQAGMTNFRRDPCASRDSFSLDYIGGRDIRVPLLTGRATGTIKTPSFGIQVNLIREQSKPSTCAALVEPEIRFTDSVVQLRTTEAGVDNGFELRLYRVDGGALVGNSTIKMKQFNPASGTYSSRMDFYGQVTRNPQKAVVEGDFRGTMNFTVIYR